MEQQPTPELQGNHDWGFINLYKDAGWTSHDCVGKLRRLLGTKKIGHGGTLDPMATGVLPIAVSKATRLLQYLPKQKTYRGIVRFGVKTTTDDLEGDVIFQQACGALTLTQIEAVLPDFLGTITQIPPAFSAIQRDGKRLYELARQGIAVDVPSRQVEVSSLKIHAWQPGDFPELTLDIHCGEGTYIRAIARDLGEKLGVGATLSGLTRTLSGGFALAESVTLEEIAAQREAGSFKFLPPDQILAHLPRLVLTATQVEQWSYGQKIAWDPDLPEPLGAPLAIYDLANHCLGIGALRPSKEDPAAIVLAGRVVLTGR
ncbi:tRNA pseudouridine(55) synthase TruB [Picosynechococcus sp. NKBG15041c]|uniref:tRNA pseudouridine(55) synthase TruB n=1 Tax=Picosynechococcus sp. NKBG15041c TaxID=1407650 RepID=UPI0003FD0580|nr:tRNA pseudouridine(55) synthase TruB [Picosynechococcus sp. NKBG15041c]